MRRSKIIGVFSIAVTLAFLLAGFSYAAHEKIPDMEHGESVTSEVPFAGTVPAKVGGGDINFEVKSAGNVTFSHDNHVGSGLKCTDCHDSLYVAKAKHKTVKMAQMQKGKSCGACHNGKKAFDVKSNCNNCHKK